MKTTRIVLYALTFAVLGCSSADDTLSVLDQGSTKVIAGPPTCDDCRISFRPVALLGDNNAPTSPREDAALRGCMVGQLSTGEYVLSGSVGGGTVVIYDSAGSYVRSFGRRGEGPGEFGRSLRVVIGPNDSIIVADDSRGRVNVLTRNGDFVRDYRVPLLSGQDFALLAGGVMAFFFLPEEHSDPLVRLLDPLGVERRRIGRVTMDRPQDEGWVLSPARDGGLWMGNGWKYELQHWDTLAALKRTIIRDVDWFPPWDGRPRPEGIFEQVAPPPFLLHVWEDTSNRLWIYSLVPDPQWRPGGSPPLEAEWARETYDMVVEVLDLDAGRPLAETRIEHLGRVCGSPLMYDVVYSAEGDTRVPILEPVLTLPPKS